MNRRGSIAPNVVFGALAALFVLAVFFAGAGALGCAGLGGSSKVAHGERYHSDDSRYDPYFDSVHQQQAACSAWPTETKAARRPLISALGLTPGSSDRTIIIAARERAAKRGNESFFAAVDETTRLERERSRKLTSASEKLEEMAKHGEELKKTADKEYDNRGADKADEKKSARSRELRRELGGAIDTMRSLSHDAKAHAHDAQEFLDDLAHAVESKDSDGKPVRRAPAPEPKPVAAPPANVGPEPAKVEPPKKEEPKPMKPAKPAHKPPPPDNVFNP